MTKEELKEMFSRSDWNEETILEADKVISRIAEEYLGLNTYPNQFEIVSSEQMLDAYSLVGLPISYNHWKFGKDFVINKSKYRRGQMGLAYELVINSNPCISYNMEDNTTCLMLLVLAHAAYGHNHFFKNNYLFKQWTHADAIVDYMLFAREYVEKCEEKYGYEEVERILDACHMIERYGVDKYTKPQRISAKKEQERLKQRLEDDRVLVDDMWRTIPNGEEKKERIDRFPKQPEENILYFIEKNSPNLKVWQRELIRIVRKTAQYFYPQGQTKVINEGCLVEGSLINTENGLMDIKEIVETKYSGKVWDGDNWRSIYDWFINEDKDRIKIVTDKGYEIHGGDNHKLFINGEWVKLSELNIGDEIKLEPKEVPYTENYVEVDYETPKYLTNVELCEMKGITHSTYDRYKDPNYPYKMSDERVRLCEEIDFIINERDESVRFVKKWELYNIPSIIDEKLAYWLGLLVGDGNTNWKNRVINFTNGDEGLVDEFDRLTYELFNYKCSIKKDDNRWRVTINSQHILHFLQRYIGIKNGVSSRIKDIPEVVLKSPKSVIKSFIKGHFDADGHISKNVIIVSNSKELLKKEQVFLHNIGIFSSLKKSHSDDTYRLYMGGEDVKHFYDEIGTNCQYKKDNFKTYFNDKKWYLEKDYVVKVVEIVKDKGDTYDFSVEETHKYSALGYINHNCATHSHYEIINKMYEEGYLTDGFMMEFFHNHSNVIFQPGFDSKFYSGLNPYTLGFNIFQDLKRMSLDPTEEDKEWFPEIAGKGNWAETFRYIVENFKDETFVLQYLSPKVIRDMRLFEVTDEEEKRFYKITSIHNKQGYRNVRKSLSETYNRATYIPDIQVYDVDVNGDRTLTLNYTSIDGKRLNSNDVDVVVDNISVLWGFPVTLIEDGDEKQVISMSDKLF